MARAIRMFFEAVPNAEGKCQFREENIEFEWHSGMSWQVRQRSSLAMEQEIVAKYPHLEGKVLEVSTKSINYELGTALSAFNLTIEDKSTGKRYPIENWFQSSKYFLGNTLLNQGEKYGPYPGLMNVSPLEAKRFVNSKLPDKTVEKYSQNALFETIQNDLKQSSFGGFELKGVQFPTEPKSVFYDCLYIRALMQEHNSALAKEILNYSAFTDIEFNSTKKAPRYNTQARACAIYVALVKAGLLEKAMTKINIFIDSVGYGK